MSEVRIVGRPVGAWGDNRMENRVTELEYSVEMEVPEREQEDEVVRVME